ncbi:hypothetical protein CYMTET_18845, partial [Cymbomonas tetramitiformis]
GGGYYRERVGTPVGLDYTPPPAVVQEAAVAALASAPVARRKPREGTLGRGRGTGKPPSGGGPRHASTGPTLIANTSAPPRSVTPDLNSTGGRRAPQQGRQHSLSPKLHTLGSMPTSDTLPPPNMEDGGVKLPLVRPPKRRDLPDELLEKYKYNPPLTVPENTPEILKPQVEVEMQHRALRRSRSECDLTKYAESHQDGNGEKGTGDKFTGLLAVLKAAKRLREVVRPGNSRAPRRSRSARDIPSVSELQSISRDARASLDQPFPSHPWLQTQADCKDESDTRHSVN